MSKAAREFIAEAQRVVDFIEGQGGDSYTWRREVEIRKGIIAGTNGGNAGTVKGN